MRSNFKVCLLILFQLQCFKLEKKYFYDKRGQLFNTTWTNNIPPLSAELEHIGFSLVTIPDSSLEAFAQLLRKLKSFNFYNSAAQCLRIPTGLIKLDIWNPLHPMEIIIDQNVSYDLESLSITNLYVFPTQISHLHSLEYFWCFSTQVIKLDFELFSRMENLTSIFMSNTYTTDVVLPESLQLKSLRRLTINRCLLSTLNATSWNFPSLIELNLGFNSFTTLPKEFAAFTNLTWLVMESNQIKFIDMHTFVDMQYLTSLTLENNHIYSIVGELQLPRLAELRLDSNHLSELDVSGWDLPALTYISLGFNRLKSVTGFVACFSRANVIDLYGGLWNCSWLEDMGRSIRGMVVEYHLSKSCYAFRTSKTNKSVLRVIENGKVQVNDL